MATSKKNSKGSKTAHVLNLLTAPGAPKDGAAGETAPDSSAASETAAPASSRPLLPPILEVAQANDDNLSQQIQQALEEELADTAPPAVPQPPQPILEEVPPMAEHPTPEQAPAPAGGKMSQEDIEKLLAAASTPEPAPEPEPPAPAPAPAGGKMSQEDIEKLLAAANTPEPAPEPEPPAPAEAPVPTASESKEEDDVSYTNIMQVLVEEKAPAYIKKFGLCTCKQCQADVMALTLTNLVPKYVVLSKLDRIPMLTVYEGRYNSTIFAQLTRACKVVMDRPHHNRIEH